MHYIYPELPCAFEQGGSMSESGVRGGTRWYKGVQGGYEGVRGVSGVVGVMGGYTLGRVFLVYVDKYNNY